MEHVNVKDVVVGDLIKLRYGMEVIGDGILVDGDDVKVDESSMTGETKLLKKETLHKCLIERERQWQLVGANIDERAVPSPILMSGTKVSQNY